jgi:DNA polymerase-3 subunit epsilon
MFHKDILLVDLEFTGLDARKHDIIQLAAVLLDKKTLKEKKSFDTYVRPRSFKNWDPEATKIHKIRPALLKNSPPIAAVLKQFNKTFPGPVILSYYGGTLDVEFLRENYARIKKPYPFNYHVFNIWGLFFVFMALQKKLNSKKYFTGFDIDDLTKRFSTPQYSHNALEDCRAEAAVLREVVKRMKAS